MDKEDKVLKPTAEVPTVARTVESIRAGICSFETTLRNLPDAQCDDCFPLKHTFAPGLYIREITMPKGTLLVTKIHKITHPYFVLKGEVSVYTERGIEHIKAPFSGMTPAGTKRILVTHEETVWTTVHQTDEVDLEKIEEDIIAKTFDEFESAAEVITISEIAQDKGEEL